MKTLSKKLTTVIMAIAVAASNLTLTACNSGRVEWDCDTTNFVTREIATLDEFSSIECSGKTIKIDYKQGKRHCIVAKSTQDKLDDTEIKTDKGKLVIRSKEIINLDKKPIIIEVTSPEIKEIELSGSTKFVSGSISAKDLKMESAGACKIKVGSITCDNMEAELSGASTIDCKIEAKEKIYIDCSGTVKGEIEAMAKTMNFECSGATKMKLCFAGDNLDIDCSGASKFDIKVDCKNVTATCSGASKMDIEGTTNTTEISASGVSSIDTKHLKKNRE